MTAVSDADAAAIREELRRQVRLGTWQPRAQRDGEALAALSIGGPPFGELLDVYEAGPAKARKSQAWQRTMISILRAEFGAVPLHEVTPERVMVWLRLAQRRGLSASTLRKYAFFLSGVYRTTARLAKHLGPRTNPIPGVRDQLVRVEHTVPRALTPEQADALLAAAEGPMYRWCVLMLRAGLRVEEAQHLTWGRVDLGARSIRVVDTKTGRDRFAGIGSVLSAEMEQWFVHDKPAPSRSVIGQVFRTQPMKRWRTLFRRAGIPLGGRDGFTARSLRTTFVSFALRGGADVVTLSRQTGHSVSTLSKWYADVSTAQKSRAADAADWSRNGPIV